jgi:phosphoglycolate phosphatase
VLRSVGSSTRSLTIFDHALFDLDGTIADSSLSITRSLHYAFTHEGFECPPIEQLHSIIGPPFEIGLPRIGIPVHDVPRVIARYRERYEDIGIAETEIFDGIHDLLSSLVARGVTLALATAKPEETAARIVEHLGVDVHLTVVAGATYSQERRGKSAVITHALEQLGGVDRSRTVMIGDREDDVVGGHQNGLRTIGVLWGFGDRDELSTAGAWSLANVPHDVLRACSGPLDSAPGGEPTLST